MRSVGGRGPDLLDHLLKHIANFPRDIRRVRIVNRLHRRHRVNGGNLHVAIALLLDDDVAREHRSNFVLEHGVPGSAISGLQAPRMR